MSTVGLQSLGGGPGLGQGGLDRELRIVPSKSGHFVLDTLRVLPGACWQQVCCACTYPCAMPYVMLIMQLSNFPSLVPSQVAKTSSKFMKRTTCTSMRCWISLLV